MITAPCSNIDPLAQTPSEDIMVKMPDINAEASPEELQKIQENRLLLQSITSYIVKDGSHVGEEVAKAILSALIPMGSQARLYSVYLKNVAL